jgi:hypothetical protein
MFSELPAYALSFLMSKSPSYAVFLNDLELPVYTVSLVAP